MQRSRFDMRGADAGAGGMSISSRSGGASGMGASSSPSSSVSSAIAHIGGPSSAGSGAMCLAKRSSREWSAAASSTASRKAPSLWARSWRHPVLQTLPSATMSAIARAAHSAEDWRRHALFMEGAIENGAGKGGARLRLDAALEAAEDGHVAGLQVRRALWREEAQHDVRECGLHGGQGGLAGVDAGHVPEEDPRLSLCLD